MGGGSRPAGQPCIPGSQINGSPIKMVLQRGSSRGEAVFCDVWASVPTLPADRVLMTRLGRQLPDGWGRSPAWARLQQGEGERGVCVWGAGVGLARAVAGKGG